MSRQPYGTATHEQRAQSARDSAEALAEPAHTHRPAFT